MNGRLRALVQEVRRTDAMVADEEPEGAHDLRVARRRTRSLLRSFRPVRDAEVVHERLAVLRADPRYAALPDTLDAFASGSPFAEADESAVRKRLRKEWRRLRRRARAAEVHPPGSPAAETALHETHTATPC